MEINAMTDSTMWFSGRNNMGGKSWGKKKQILNLNRFLLELVIVGKMGID